MITNWDSFHFGLNDTILAIWKDGVEPSVETSDANSSVETSDLWRGSDPCLPENLRRDILRSS